jgi:transcriptional regulator with GAF, ATPase, and Fis domain
MAKAGSHTSEREARITSDVRGVLKTVDLRAAQAGSLRGITEHGLFDLYDRMLGGIEIPAVLRDVAEVVRQNFHCERASIYLLDRSSDELESVAVIGNVARTIRVPISRSSLAGYCATTRRTFLVPDAYGDLSGIDPDLRFDRKWDRLNKFRTRDVMCAPALFRDEVVGVVQIINSTGTPFCESDLAPLRIVSRLIGYALYHARLYDDLATLKQLEKEKAQFMRVMVHELKSPVAGAKMMADALQYHDSIAGTPAIDVTRKSPIAWGVSPISSKICSNWRKSNQAIHSARLPSSISSRSRRRAANRTANRPSRRGWC